LVLNTASRKMPPKDLGTAFVAEGVVCNQPDARAGDEGGQELDQEDTTDFVPVPGGRAEKAKSGVVAVIGGAAGGFPDAADGAASQADNPGRDHEAEGGIGLATEANPEGL
jgi:hypothetical protein